jgi:cyanophycinase-like exopeptidase
MALRKIASAYSVEGATKQVPIGLGIDEDTAIVIKEGHKAEVIGSGKVTIVRYIPPESSQQSDDDFDITIIDPGQSFDLHTVQ